MAADRMQASGAMRQRPPHAPRSVSIPADEVRLDGELTASQAAAAGTVTDLGGSWSVRHLGPADGG